MNRPAAAETGRFDVPRIYAASLTDYNAGCLHGAWLPADDLSGLHDGIAAMLSASPTADRTGEVAEEWAIHDTDGFGPSVRLDEYESLATVALLAQGIAEHGPSFAAWWSYCDPELPSDADRQEARWRQLKERYEEAYLGEHDSPSAYVEAFLEDLGLDLDAWDAVPEFLRAYISIDVGGLARDMELGGDVTTVQSERGVYVFSAR